MPAALEDVLRRLRAEEYDPALLNEVADALDRMHERIKNLELWHLESKTRLATLEKASQEHGESITSLAKHRDENIKRIDTIEHKPDADHKKVEELDKRVTAVEGAVGSRAFKQVEERPEPVVVEEPPRTAPAPFVARDANWPPPQERTG